MFQPLYSRQSGEFSEDPRLVFIGRSGAAWREPEPGEMIPMPVGASLVMMPGHRPVGMDPSTGQPVLVQAGTSATAVAALLPQGYTRTLLPAAAVPQGTPELPTLGYTAAAFKNGKIYIAAMKTDRDFAWNPKHYNTERLADRIAKRLKQSPKNRILQQLSHCSQVYSCFTAQNVFYERWEGGIPTSPSCNAQCLGCISRSHTAVCSPQSRLEFLPTSEEIAEVAEHHLSRAGDGIISFGQGCEGEPSLAADRIAPAVKAIRDSVAAGTVNINTNAGNTQGIQKIVDSGLDAMRVTLFSARKEDYQQYHQPNYTLEDVAASIRYAADAGVYISLNLLTMPGFTDSMDQADALLAFIDQLQIPMVQFRNLNLDPVVFESHFPVRSEPIGIPALIRRLRDAGVRAASYSHPARRGAGLIGETNH
ncbi:MAG: radical SAM protein [Solirubrobacterales bacterium]